MSTRHAYKKNMMAGKVLSEKHRKRKKRTGVEKMTAVEGVVNRFKRGFSR